jgi:uncharacterized RDD family membrane protein YckC
VGLIAYTVTGMWGLGIGTTAAFGGMKREAPEKPSPPPGGIPPVVPPGPVMPMVVPPAVQNISPNLSSGPGVTPEVNNPGSATAAMAASINPPQPAAAAVTGVPEAFAYPRGGFWERMGAAFLDIVIVGIITGMVGGYLDRILAPPVIAMLIALAYFTGMWTWKGMTVGGVVLNLKVVRLDGRPMTFPVALVRGLGAVLSTIVMFLGFLWIAWDADKQGWHDRIAGTVVVRVPRGTSLVCL